MKGDFMRAKLYVRYSLCGPLFRPVICTDADGPNQKQANEDPQ